VSELLWSVVLSSPAALSLFADGHKKKHLLELETTDSAPSRYPLSEVFSHGRQPVFLLTYNIQVWFPFLILSVVVRAA
jgi:hypothetical protein